MTRRYTRETPERLNSDRVRYLTHEFDDGTTATGYAWHADIRFPTVTDFRMALELPVIIARGEVTPVPVDLKREAATFARAKKR